MKIALTDKYTGEVVHTEAFFTRHSQHSPDGSLVMIFETGRELTGIVWRLAQARSSAPPVQSEPVITSGLASRGPGNDG